MDVSTSRPLDSGEASGSGSSSNGVSAAPAQRQVLYRKYDPAKVRRISQLSIASSGDGAGHHTTSAAPPTRVLGGRPASVVSISSPRSIGSANAAHNDSLALGMADSAAKHGHDYFVQQHSDSTSHSLALRQRERVRLEQSRHNSYSSSGSSHSAGDSSRGATSAMVTPRLQDDRIFQQDALSQASESRPAMPDLNTVSSRSSHLSATSATSNDTFTQSGPTQNAAHSGNGSANTSLPRSQSAMATLQRESSVSSRHSGFRQFIPPSAYAIAGSSAASSPGQLPNEAHPSTKPRMSAHLSSALARGLNNVNGMLDGSSPVRLPQSATNVANAVWSKLPPAVQQLKHEMAWDWENGSQDHHQTVATAGLPAQGSSEQVSPRMLVGNPPSGSRSLSLGAVQLAQDRDREAQRPSSSASQMSSRGGMHTAHSTGPATPTSPEAWQPAHPQSLRLADQLRLDYANKQLTQKPKAPPIPRGKQPYRSGYQPRNGVYRNQTDLFLELRSQRVIRGSGDSNLLLHEERLLRRLEKLVDLHFPLPDGLTSAQKTGIGSKEYEDSHPSEKTEATALVKAGINFRRPGDVFGKMIKGVMKSSSTGNLTSSEMRASDQSIVKWQNDSEATSCPICGAPFNLVTRKHHCRLCGRVVCFLPPNTTEIPTPPPKASEATEGTDTPTPAPEPAPLRSVRCSSYILYDRYPTTGSSQSLIGAPKTVQGEHPLLSTGTVREVDLGDFPPVQALSALSIQERDMVEAELDTRRAKEIKAGVRVCRDCLNVVMKRQKKSQPKRQEPWLRLYIALTQLEQDIELILPQLSELRSNAEPTVEVVKQFNSVRKTILKSLTSYDMLAKRIRDLPASAGSPLSPPLRSTSSGGILPSAAPTSLTSSQERLQKAIYSKAMLFLGEKMAIMKGLGGLTVKASPKPHQAEPAPVSSGQIQKLDMEDDKAQEEKMARLAVLYEQEALVSGYLDDANARRQFEDATALKSSLDDLRSEIQNLVR